MSGKPKGPAVRRDCRCTTVRHEHGTNNAYLTDGCRCTPCRAAAAAVAKNRWRKIGYGTWTTQYVDATGTRRRVQALMTLGWDMHSIAQRIGMTHSSQLVHGVAGRKRILRTTAVKVAAVYDELWDQPRVGATKGERIAVSMTIARATRNGYLPPLAWDDDLIDDPDHGRKLQPCGTHAAYVRHKERGEPIDKACAEGQRAWNRDRMRATRVKDTAPEFVDETAVEEAMRGRRVTLTDAERHEAIRRLTAAGKSASAIASLLNTTGRTVTRRRAAEVAA